MSNELLYLGIGAAAVYLFARAKKTTPADTEAAKPSVVPGVTPGTTPGIAPYMPQVIPDDLDYTKPIFNATGKVVGYQRRNVSPAVDPSFYLDTGMGQINPETGNPYTLQEWFNKGGLFNSAMAPSIMKGDHSPKGIDANGNIVFGDDVKNITPQQWVFAITDEAAASSISLQEAFDKILAAAVTALDKSAIVEAGLQLKLRVPGKGNVVMKSGISMAATVALIAGGYYLLANR